jgi:hypothetical protein
MGIYFSVKFSTPGMDDSNSPLEKKGFLRYPDNKMPVISEFFGIKIYMYWNEHFPEHFHAEYGSAKALISIPDAVVIKGALPAKQLKLVLAWCEIHRGELMTNWLAARAHDEISKIDPLR